MENTDKEIILLLKSNGEKAMEEIYSRYYNYLCHATYKILNDSVATEDIVQDVLMEIWKKKETINITISLKAYLRRASINKALNYLRGKKIKFEDDDSYKETFIDSDDSLEKLEYNEDVFFLCLGLSLCRIKRSQQLWKFLLKRLKIKFLKL